MIFLSDTVLLIMFYFISFSNLAVADYLRASGYTEAYNNFVQEADVVSARGLQNGLTFYSRLFEYTDTDSPGFGMFYQEQIW